MNKKIVLVVLVALAICAIVVMNTGVVAADPTCGIPGLPPCPPY